MLKNIIYTKNRGSMMAMQLLLCAVMITSCFKKVDVPQLTPQTGVLQMSPASGPKNTVLNITGTNFPDAAGIVLKVNGKTVPITSATSSNIQATIPVGTGTGKVEVTFGGNTYDAGTFTYLNSYTVTDLTNGSVGTQDGPLATAELEDVESLAIDGADNLYVGNYYGTQLRKINLNTGTVSTLATQTGGNEFVAADAAGNVFYVDQDNNQLVKVTPAGVTSVIVAPSFGIQGVDVGASGNLYVSGRTNIAKYSPTGTLLWRLTSHGSGNVNGDTSVARFALYGNIEVDPTETKIYVVNNTLVGAYPSEIKLLDLTAKTMNTIAGNAVAGHVDGDALDAEFSLAYSVTLDKSGGLYIADNGNSAIRYLKDGKVSTVIGGVAGGDAPGVGPVAKLNGPQHVIFDSKGIMYIADWGNNKIYKVVID